MLTTLKQGWRNIFPFELGGSNEFELGVQTNLLKVYLGNRNILL